MSQSLSIIVICKNEEKVIERCITAISEDLRSYDEIIVVDTGSTDNTLSILNRMKNIKILHFPWNDDFSEARNFGIANANKDWIFFIDSDEILVKGSLYFLEEAIENIESNSKESEKIVFAPKIINKDDSVLYNAGRILPNDGSVRFNGIVHEYPYITKGNLYLISIKMPKVVVKHDGYEKIVVKDKDKIRRNTQLLKKIIDREPNNSRYYYFYYRDARPLLSDEEYECAMLAFFEKFPNDSYSNQVAKDLSFYFLSHNKNDEAEKYIDILFKSASEGNVEDRSVAIYLTAIKEIQKMKLQKKELLKLLIYTKANVIKQEESLFANGYAFDDLIGLLFFDLGDFNSAYMIGDILNSEKFDSNLTKLLANIREGILKDEL